MEITKNAGRLSQGRITNWRMTALPRATLKIESEADLTRPVATDARDLAEARVEDVGDDPAKKVSVEHIQELRADLYPHALSDNKPFTETEVFSHTPWISHVGGESSRAQGERFVVGKHTGSDVAMIFVTGG